MRQLSKLSVRVPSELSYTRFRKPTEWDSGRIVVKDFKAYFRRKSLINQNYRCCYCLDEISDVGNRDDDIEHFADKKRYPMWAFTPDNLLMSCGRCNRRLKHAKDSVVVKRAPYECSIFSIVHPYFDEVEKHISGGYPDDSKEPTAHRWLSKKGERTGVMFNLESPNLYKRRFSDYRERKIERLRNSNDQEDQKTYAILAELLGDRKVAE